MSVTYVDSKSNQTDQLRSGQSSTSPDQVQVDAADHQATNNQDDVNSPFSFLGSVGPDTSSHSETDGDSEDLEDLLNDTPQDDSDAKIGGVLETYLATVKGNIMSALGSSHLPPCYQQGQFWIYPPSPYFAMYKAERSLDSDVLNPTSLYYPAVFLWLPHLLDSVSIITCHNPSCSFYKDKAHSMVIKGWNTNPIARRVIGLDQNYYIMTM